MKATVLLVIFLLGLIFTGSQAVTLKSKLSYDVQSIDASKKPSSKIFVSIEDLDYKIPIETKKHILYGYIEFDTTYLIKFRALKDNSRYIHADEISMIISNQLDQTAVRVNLRQKFFEEISHDFDDNILVEILNIESLKDNQVRCYFKAELEFPIQVKAKYQSLDQIHSRIKFKIHANKNNFFHKSKSNGFCLTRGAVL